MLRAAVVGRLLLVIATAAMVLAADARADDACLVGFDLQDVGKLADGMTVQGAATKGKCTFAVGLCVDKRVSGCTAGQIKRKVRAKGRCAGANKLKVTPNGTNEVCSSDGGTFGHITVRTKKHGKKPGSCTIKTTAKTTDGRSHTGTVTLVCQPETVTCDPIVRDNQGIPGTYELESVTGPKICQTSSTQNRFGPCSSDADCGGAQGNCTATPFATAGGFVLPFPEGIKTVFTVASEAAPPSCNHAACIECGNAGAACAGTPGCGAPPGQPAAGCTRNTCCDTPGFTIPTFVVPIIGGLCSRLDQIDCGSGIVNSSDPQVGDNEVTRLADTSDPGPDCRYGTADDPAPTSCTTSGEGHDTKGFVERTVGNGMFDASGIQYRLAVPALSSTWIDSVNPCPQGSTFDPGETLVTQLVLNTEFSTAGATAGFVDLNGDGCALAGAGFTGADKAGPFTIGSPPASPQPYDGSAGSVAAAAGVALTGSPPLFDLGFVAFLSNRPITRQPTATCSCTPTPGCPE